MQRISLSLALVLVCTGTAYAEGQASRLIPFDEFVQGVSASELRMFQGQAETQVTEPAAFDAMRQHLLSLYQGVHVAHSFVLESQVFDCVPLAEQPSVRLLGLKGVEEPPAPSALADNSTPQQGLNRPIGAASPLQLGQVDAFGNAIQCDRGTIPMRRVTLEEMTRFESLKSFFSKGPGGAGRPYSAQPQPNVALTHKYAHAYQFVNNLGGDSWVNLWSPGINTGAGQIFSLSQHWYVGGSGAGLQTVEGGWQVFPSKYGTTNAVTFIYWTPDNYTTGCYNLECPGFVQVSYNFGLGGPWTVYSAWGGAQYEFQMQWKLYAGNWWLFLQGSGSLEAVGYYPGSLYRGGQLSQFATEIDYGGETVGPATWPGMGSGDWSGSGWTRAAYQRNIFYIDGASNGQWSSLSSAQPSPSCYSLTYTPASTGTNWGTYFFFGGPGGTSC
jgi:neprosin-like protein